MDVFKPQPADAFQIAREDDEIVIEFGRVDELERPAGETVVSVTDRIRIPVETARRLMRTLEDSLKPLQVSLQRAEAQGLSPGDAALAARPGQFAARPRPDQSGEHAARLLQMVGEWDVPHLYERSFQISEGSLRSNRFLLTVNTVDIPGDKRDDALAVCGAMGMGGAQREVAAAHFDMAKCIHFGFEGDDQNVICKLYLERAVGPEEAKAAHEAGEPVLLHLAFKWNLVRSDAVTTRYHWRPYLDAGQIAARMSEVYRDGRAESLAIAREFLTLAATRLEARQMQYLEVEEVGNQRRSFDLNLYDARLQVRDAQHLLMRTRDHFHLRPGQFQALYDQIKAMSLGHLAGGVHRKGEDFFNLYYGAAALPRFSSGLNQA